MASTKSAKSYQEHLFIVEDDKGRHEIPLKDPSYSLGRDQRCDICLSSQFVSRRHARLLRKVRQDGSSYYQIVDGDSEGRPSANGLLINGYKRQSHDLKDRDEVVFGPQVFAIYKLIRRDVFPTAPDDPYDITLIDPAMMLNDPSDDL